ncbi:MAG: SUMF1/EgtB/PvdO family nonheme iron enzyme, partial [Planctomycetota bacterium]
MALMEKDRYDDICKENNPERIVDLAEKYKSEFQAGRNMDAVLKILEEKQRERAAFLDTQESAENCTRYLTRFPAGFYRKTVENEVLTFAWTAEDNKGIGYQGKLPQGLKRGKLKGVYIADSDVSEMVFVPKGFFPMGSDDFRGEDCDGPQFMAWTTGFFIDMHELSNDKYRVFLGWITTAKNVSFRQACKMREPTRGGSATRRARCGGREMGIARGDGGVELRGPV